MDGEVQILIPTHNFVEGHNNNESFLSILAIIRDLIETANIEPCSHLLLSQSGPSKPFWHLQMNEPGVLSHVPLFIQRLNSHSLMSAKRKVFTINVNCNSNKVIHVVIVKFNY